MFAASGSCRRVWCTGGCCDLRLACLFFIFVYGQGASSAAVAPGFCTVFLYVHRAFPNEVHTVACERSLQRSIHALDGRRAILSIHPSILEPAVVSRYHGSLVREPLSEYSPFCRRNRMAFHSVEHLRSAILLMMKQKSERKSWIENKSGSVYPSMLHSRKAVTYTRLQAIAMMNQVRVQENSPCKKRSREPLRAYPARDISLLPNAVSSMSAKIGEFAFQTERINCVEKFSVVSA